MTIRSIQIQKEGKQYRISGNFSTFIWKDRESDCYIAFVPELDLAAYDTTKGKVLKSLEVVMDEFFRYTIRQGTLDAELAKLGWKGAKDSFEAPTMESVASRNQQFSAVLNPVPEFIVKNILRTLGMSREEFLAVLDEL